MRLEHGPGAGLASAKAGDRAVAATAIRAAAADAARLGVCVLILEPGFVPLLGGDTGDDLTDETEQWTRDRAAALRARCRPERDAALDRVCRALFALRRELPDAILALTPSARVTGLG
jgi:hypothetical protein